MIGAKVELVSHLKSARFDIDGSYSRELLVSKSQPVLKTSVIWGSEFACQTSKSRFICESNHCLHRTRVAIDEIQMGVGTYSVRAPKLRISMMRSVYSRDGWTDELAHNVRNLGCRPWPRSGTKMYYEFWRIALGKGPTTHQCAHCARIISEQLHSRFSKRKSKWRVFAELRRTFKLKKL